jgi:CHAT domain-containing protein
MLIGFTSPVLSSHGSIPISFQTSSIQPETQTSPIAPIATKLNPIELKSALDRNDFSNAIRQVELGWKFQYETYYQGKFTNQYLELPEIQQRLTQLKHLTGKTTALIYAIPGQSHLDILLVSPEGKPIHHRIAADSTTLTTTLQRLRIGIVNPTSQPQDYLPAAQQLHQWLIQPIEADLKKQNIDTLIFCMGTGLRSMPLAALHDGKQFLVEKYNLALIPAFNLLDHRPSFLSGTQVLAMGATEFKTQKPLPAVELELSTITQDLWPGRSLLNEDFTLEKLQKERSKTPYGIIHLATHANISAQSAEDSYLQFWDQAFPLSQMRNLNLRIPVVQLLILSACRTALGNPQAELGFAGLSVQSGAKATIASLWSVSDGGSMVLMTDFYRQLKTADIKAEALRNSQIALLRGKVNLKTQYSLLPPALVPLKDADLSHPYYWAAFTLVGNPW